MNLSVPKNLNNTAFFIFKEVFVSRFLNNFQMNVKSRHLSFPILFLLISVVQKFDLSHYIIHLPVIQAFYDFFSSQSIDRNNFLYTVGFFFSFHFY